MHEISDGARVPLFLATGAALTVSLLWLLRRSPFAKIATDDPARPNTLHQKLTPRIGGVGVVSVVVILAGLLRLFGMVETCLVNAIWMCCFLSMFSFLDDRRDLSAVLRLGVHIAMATVIVLLWVKKFSLSPDSPFGARTIGSPMVAIALALAITWSTNLFNFMDGADGMAGGMAVIGFGAYAIAASQIPATNTTAVEFAHVSAIISGAALGFLFFNFPPAKIFMGDAGSIPLGFLAATLGIQGYLSNLWPWWFPILVFSPFIVDATVTLLKRAVKREKIWLGHRQHAYQRLILSGWSHRQTALTYYALMLACAGSALLARHHSATAFFLWAWVVIYALLLATVEMYLARKNKKKSEPL